MPSGDEFLPLFRQKAPWAKINRTSGGVAGTGLGLYGGGVSGRYRSEAEPNRAGTLAQGGTLYRAIEIIFELVSAAGARFDPRPVSGLRVSLR